jgi:rhamnulokinase
VGESFEAAGYTLAHKISKDESVFAKVVGSLMTAKQVIAIDLGGESGRVIQVEFDGKTLNFNVLHRFPNIPVFANGTLYWDVLRLWHEIEHGISKASPDAASIGIDTWGVDGALLDRNGKLLGNPVHYRDRRNEGMMDWVFERIPKRELFNRTGIQFIQFNGIFQLASLIRDDSAMLDMAATFLTIPDLFNYWLSGSRTCEFTHVTTQQLYDPFGKTWDWKSINDVGLPAQIFPEIVQPGTRLGEYKGIPVIAPATHDTGSAVVAVPTTTPHYAYISSGTWSLVGLEIDEPIINDETFAANLTNEGGYEGKFRFLKNCMGLWLAQQSRNTWAAHGNEQSYEMLTEAAIRAEPFRSLFDPDDVMFLPVSDMPETIREFCRRTRQPLPETSGQVIRAIYESLALKYRFHIENMMRLANKRVDRIHIVGGGSQNAFLNQMTADATGKAVIAGPSEATALGNAIVQLITAGELGNMAQARQMLSQSSELRTFQPKQLGAWDSVYQTRFLPLVTTP